MPKGKGKWIQLPIEFSIAAFRLGHSMVRAAYDWNRIFANGGGTLEFLFRFSGTSGGFNPFGDINDQEAGLFERLPTNWRTDGWRSAVGAGAGMVEVTALPT